MFTKATLNILTINKIVALLAFLFAINCSAQSWTQQMACPGWNNPTSFATGSTDYYYSGGGGSAHDKTAPHVDVCTTSCTWSGINWNTTYSAGQMMTGTTPGCNTYAYDGFQQIPQHDHSFAIMDTNTQAATSGCPKNRDPNTKGSDNVYHLPFVPNIQYNTYDTTPGFVNTNLATSIRIGDDCAAPSHDAAGRSSVALYYHVRPTSENALFFIYYAAVVTAPTHSIDENPAFVIAVEKEKTPGCWVAVSDTLVYAITMSYYMPIESNYNTNGWHNANGGNIKFKDWTRVAINLNNHLYENLRIHVSIGDCFANFHPAYAYVCGECRPMALISRNSTITAPTDLLAYEWAASEYGVSAPICLDPGMHDDYFTFRTLTTASGQPANTAEYQVKGDDFRILYRPNANKIPNIAASPDSIGAMQTFRCRMTTAIDPTKPYSSDLYINIPRSIIPLTVTATVNDSSMGSTIGGGQFEYGEVATVGALPKQGFGFSGWDNGSSNNPYTLTVTQDTVLTALLEPIINIVDTIIINNYIHDTITIHDTVFVGGNEGIDGMVATNTKIFQRNGNIVVEGVAGQLITVYDEIGRTVAVKKDVNNCTIIEAPASGVYHIKIGANIPRRIVLIKE